MTAVLDGPGRSQREPSWSSAPLTIATLLLMLTAVWLRQGSGGSAFPGWPLLTFTLLAWIPLVVRTRWPLRVLVLTVVVHAAQLLLLPKIDPDLVTPVGMAAYQPVPVATMIAAYTVAVRLPRRTAWIAGATASVILPVTALIGQPNDFLLTNLVMLNLVLDGTAAGALIAARHDRLAQQARERAQATQRAVEAERLRIAGELHDVLAHHLTLVNAQVGVADYLLGSNPEAARTALHGLAGHTRQALEELRATVGLLRNGAADSATDEVAERKPMPGLERLEDLLSDVRSAGTNVRLLIDGEPRPMSAGADLAAYRIVQESLTNATKHAPGTSVDVHLEWREQHLRLRVENSAAAGDPPPGGGTGHGLIGMQERARAAGGTVTADRTPSGGFAVDASLPTASRSRTPQTQETP